MHVPSIAKIVENLYSSSRLFHQIDRGRGSGKNHGKKSQELIMVEDNVSIWYTRHHFVSDNGTQFANTMVTDFCNDLGVQAKPMSTIHPQVNG